MNRAIAFTNPDATHLRAMPRKVLELAVQEDFGRGHAIALGASAPVDDYDAFVPGRAP